jgi:hypothetical protein
VTDYFFSGREYIRVSRGDTGPGTMDPGYPAPISAWHWGAFGANGIDAALYSGSRCYFFSGKQYIRVTRGQTGPGTIDPGYPAPISNWNWGPFGANGIDGALYSGSKCYFFSGDQYIRVSRGDIGPGLMDPGYPAPISSWGWGNFGAKGIRAPLYSGGPLVAPPPATGLVSNHNYFLDQAGNLIRGLSVTVNIDADFNSSANGWSMQLNGYSTAGDVTGLQQYIVYAGPGSSQLVARIDNWDGLLNELVRADVNLATLPGATLPAGYSITIALTYDSSGNVTGSNYIVLDYSGNTVGMQTIGIAGQILRTTGEPATPANLAPIYAFQFNIGGDYGGARAALSSGIGTITYSASQPLTVANAAPSYIDDQNVYSQESANLVFGELPVASHLAVTQSFMITAESSKAAREKEIEFTKITGKRPKPRPPLEHPPRNP